MNRTLKTILAVCIISLCASAYAFQINSGVPGHSPTVIFGTGSDADRLAIDGAVQGPHLTGPAGANGAAGVQGPQGATGPQGPAGTTQTAAQIIAALQAAFPGLTYVVSGPSASGAGLVPDTATQTTITALTTAGAATVLWRDTTGTSSSATVALAGKGGAASAGTVTAAGTSTLVNATVALIGKGGTGSIGTLTISTSGTIVAVNLTGQGGAGGNGSFAVVAQAFGTASLIGQGGAGGAGTVTATGGAATVNGSASLTGEGGAGGAGTVTASVTAGSTNLVNATTYDSGKFTFYTAGTSLSTVPSTLNGDGSYTIKSYNGSQTYTQQNGYAGLITSTTYASPYTVSFNLNMSSSMLPSWQAAGDPQYVAWTYPGTTTLPTTTTPPYSLAIGQRYASGVYYVKALLHAGTSYYSMQADGSWSTTAYEFPLSEAGCNVQIQCTANSPETYVVTFNKLDGVTNIKTSATSPSVSGVASDKIVLGDVFNLSGGSGKADYFYVNANFSNLTGF